MSRQLAWRIAPVAAAALTVVVYFVMDPRISDLPAAQFRAWLFEDQGFTIWNGQWYAGHHTPGYSVLFPPLAALLGPEVVGALAVLTSAALFERIVTRHFGPAARWGALLFGLGAGTLLFSARLPWALGATFALAAVLALQHRRVWAAALLGVLATLSSPVAGAFLALGSVAYALAGRSNRRAGAIVAAAGLVPPLVLTAAFPEGGYHPFVFSSFFVVPLVALAAIPFLRSGDRDRTLRIACVLYALVAVALFAVHTPFGGNTVRLGQLVGAPLLLCALVASPPRKPTMRAGAAALLAGLLWWQWGPVVREERKVSGDPSVDGTYYQPLVDYLKRQGGPPARVTIPQMRSQGDTYYVAKEMPTGRGWLRQIDVKLNPLFYDGKLTSERYRRWLGEHAVRWVAVPDNAPIGYGGEAEIALIAREGPDYLRVAARVGHWTVYEVEAPHPMVVPEGRAAIAATALRPDQVDLDVRRPGSAIVRVHFSPYWRLADGPGCVERAGDWTRVRVERPGRVRLVTTFAPRRVVSRGPRCG